MHYLLRVLYDNILPTFQQASSFYSLQTKLLPSPLMSLFALLLLSTIVTTHLSSLSHDVINLHSIRYTWLISITLFAVIP